MNQLSRTDEFPRSSTMIRVRGVLDMAEAVRLAGSFRDMPQHVVLYVDVRSAREVHDAALVALAHAVALRNGVMTGLSRHHATLLAYVAQAPAEAAP